MRVIDQLEHMFNALAWKRLGIKPLTVESMPEEFRRVDHISQFDLLRQREVELVTTPLQLKPESLHLLQRLTPDDIKGGTVDVLEPTNANFPKATSHNYKINRIDRVARRLHRLEADEVYDTLWSKLPNQNGRHQLASDLTHLFMLAERCVGPVSIFRFGVGSSWMPSPHKHAPHEDTVKTSGVQLVATLDPRPDRGTLVVPDRITRPHRRVERVVNGDEEMNFPSHATFDTYGKGNVYITPPLHLSAWRTLDAYNERPNGPTLAHSTPPFAGAPRPVLTMTVSRPKWPGWVNY